MSDPIALGRWLTEAPLLGHSLRALTSRMTSDDRIEIRLPYVVDAVGRDGWAELGDSWQQCFSATALSRALADAGLRLSHAQRHADDAGSWLYVWVVTESSFLMTSDDAVWLLEQEWAAGVRSPDFLRSGRALAQRIPLRREHPTTPARVAA